MNTELQDELTDAVYRAALEPQAWNDVMRLMNAGIPSSAQTFYFLDLQPRRIRPMALAGVAPRWVRSFDPAYFAPDNPWIRLTARLHRPGVVRTNERLAHVLGDADALYRSVYYNEWMRPQGFKYTLGTTLMAGSGVVANVTLLRPPDMPTFSREEVALLERIGGHMTRAMDVAVRLEEAETRARDLLALDGAAHAVAVVDAQARILHTNARMDALVRRGTGLAVRDGMLVASQATAHARLLGLIAQALDAHHGADAAHRPLALPRAHGTQLLVRASPACGAPGRYLPASPTVRLTVTEVTARPSVSTHALRSLYDCTPSEAALVAQLVDGRSLQDAAAALRITYATARTYLKLVFGKAGVHSQSQLVARVLGDVSGMH